jgi:hypothetical protein
MTEGVPGRSRIRRRVAISAGATFLAGAAALLAALVLVFGPLM